MLGANHKSNTHWGARGAAFILTKCHGTHTMCPQSGRTLPVAHGVPFWLFTLTDPSPGKTMDAWVLNVLESATSISYRNTKSAPPQPPIPLESSSPASATVTSDNQSMNFTPVQTLICESEATDMLGTSGEDDSKINWRDLVQVKYMSRSSRALTCRIPE